MKILIMDNDKAALDRLFKILLRNEPQAEIMPFLSIRQFEEYPQKNGFDIAFIETLIGDASGIDLALKLKEVSPLCNIIFVTSHEEYAAQSFRVRPSGFVLKPYTENDIVTELKNLRYPLLGTDNKKKLKIITFGSFIVYNSSGELFKFSRNMSKTILAYLVDQCGYPVTSRDIARDVFEEDSFKMQTSKNISKYVAFLMKDLKAAGAEDVIVKQNRSLTVNKTIVDCDLYRALEGDTEAIKSFHGEYLIEYSWAEVSDSARKLRNIIL